MVTAVVFVALAVWSSNAVLTRPLYDRLADLHVYLGAVRTIRDGLPLYAYAAENGDPFTYPPFAALVLYPLGALPEPAVRVGWTVLSVAGIVALAVALRIRNRALLFGAAVLLLVSAPVQSNLRFGQVSLFVVLLTLVDAAGLLPRRWGGVLVGLAAAIKLTPLLFVPYLWIVGRRRDALQAAGAFAGCTALAFAVWPAASVTFWTEAMFATSRVGDVASAANQSLNGMALRYGLPSPVWLLLGAVVCVIALWSAGDLHRRGQVVFAAVVVGCATVAVSPVSWTHHQIWTVLAGILLLAGPGRAGRIAGTLVLVTMTVQLGALIPDSRLLCAVAVLSLGRRIR